MNPFITEDGPQWSEAVDYLRSGAADTVLLKAIADMIEDHAGDGGAPGLVQIATRSIGEHPMAREG